MNNPVNEAANPIVYDNLQWPQFLGDERAINGTVSIVVTDDYSIPFDQRPQLTLTEAQAFSVMQQLASLLATRYDRRNPNAH